MILLEFSSANAIVAQAALEAAKVVREDFDLYWTLLSAFAGVIVLVVGFVGYSQIRDIKSRLKDDVLNAVRNEINSDDFTNSIKFSVQSSLIGELKQNSESLERQIELGRLQKFVDRVKQENPKINKDERADLFEKIWKLKDDSSITSTAEYIDAVDAAINFFYMSSEWEKIDRIDSGLRSLCSSNHKLYMSMIGAYGFRVLSESSVSNDTLKSFSYYSDVCRDRNYMEVSYCYWMPHVYNEGGEGSAKSLAQCLEDLSHLKKFEIKSFLDGLEARSNIQNVSDNPGPRHHRFIAKFLSFTEAYKPQLDKLRRSVGSSSEEDNANQQQNRPN